MAVDGEHGEEDGGEGIAGGVDEGITEVEAGQEDSPVKAFVVVVVGVVCDVIGGVGDGLSLTVGRWWPYRALRKIRVGQMG